MDICHACQNEVGLEYFRLNADMICATCGRKFQAEEADKRWSRYWRGLLFGFGAMVLGALCKWGLYWLTSLDRESGQFSSLFSVGAYARGFSTFLSCGLVGFAMHFGSMGRGSRLLQISGALMCYLAYCVGLSLFVLSVTPSARITPAFILGVILVSPALPFLIVAKSVLNISGLVLLFFGITGVWSVLGNRPDLTGPYENGPETPRAQPMFKTLGG